VTRLKWKLDTVHLDIVLLLMHDWCTVRVEHTVGSEIVLEAPDGTPRLRGSCGILFRSVFETVLALVQDRCSVCVKRTIGSQIILEAPKILLGDEGLVEICSVHLETILQKIGARFALNVP
jgi:uncharacterized membrane protein